jgi:hypothetical protein
MTEKDFEKIDSMIARRVGTFADSIQHKLGLILEEQRMLSEQLNGWRADLESSNRIRQQKLDAVAADLSAHRADTEAHRKVYKIKED